MSLLDGQPRNVCILFAKYHLCMVYTSYGKFHEQTGSFLRSETIRRFGSRLQRELQPPQQKVKYVVIRDLPG